MEKHSPKFESGNEILQFLAEAEQWQIDELKNIINSHDELLEACKDTLRTLEYYKKSEYSRSVLRKVIAKAEGK